MKITNRDKYNKKIRRLVLYLFIIVIICCTFLCVKHWQGIIFRVQNALLNAEISFKYDGENSISEEDDFSDDVNQKYIAIGFDDFRISDFTMVAPMLEEYGATATFNIISKTNPMDKVTMGKIDYLMENGNSLGDHTWFHENFIFSDPMINGQDYNSIDGNQEPYPSNDDLRKDVGDGKNIFGIDLSEKVNDTLQRFLGEGILQIEGVDCAWGELGDNDCQKIRDTFSIYKTPEIINTLDDLSNEFLGTSGNSYGSWSDSENCYTGGIFKGARTSCNHEIWERILEITKLYYQKYYNKDFIFKTWSWPGAKRSPFYYEKDGLYYYDNTYTKLYNYLARFQSSLYTDDEGNNLERSWTDVLRSAGYEITHDTIFPSRMDGTETTLMSKQLIFNASLSRQDALTYRTNSSISYDEIASEFSEEEYNEAEDGIANKMYDAGGSFYSIIENIRKDTSNGLIYGEIIDSVDSYSERLFMRELLKFCQKENIKVITKEEAYNICFNHIKENGNLIYNPSFKNSAKDYLNKAENIPSAPDGYEGDCTTENLNGINSLIVTGNAQYLHYGIPLGAISYKANVKGNGTIKIYQLKNSDTLSAIDNLELIGSSNIESNDYSQIEINFNINDYPLTDYEQRWEGYGNKVMGILIVYSGKLEVNNLILEKQK